MTTHLNKHRNPAGDGRLPLLEAGLLAGPPARAAVPHIRAVRRRPRALQVRPAPDPFAIPPHPHDWGAGHRPSAGTHVCAQYMLPLRDLHHSLTLVPLSLPLLLPNRQMAAGDQLRVIYDSLSRDPNSLANLDQDLPNYAQHQVCLLPPPRSMPGAEHHPLAPYTGPGPANLHTAPKCTLHQPKQNDHRTSHSPTPGAHPQPTAGVALVRDVVR